MVLDTEAQFNGAVCLVLRSLSDTKCSDTTVVARFRRYQRRQQQPDMCAKASTNNTKESSQIELTVYLET